MELKCVQSNLNHTKETSLDFLNYHGNFKEHSNINIELLAVINDADYFADDDGKVRGKCAACSTIHHFQFPKS